MKAKFVYEMKIQPNKELFNKFKEIFKDVLESKTYDPFAELNDRLNSFNIYLVDFQGHLDNLSPEEQQIVNHANIIPPMGIRLMGYDPPSSQLFIAVDKTFDDKFINMSQHELDFHLNKMWSAFGHETIHMGQVDRMKVKQDPQFHSSEEYYGNKQEIMALAFSFVEEMRDQHSDEEILNKIKTSSNNRMGMRMGMQLGMPMMPPSEHPLLGIYRDLGGKAYKLFIKYVYQYLQEDEQITYK